jgi:hypothetical protein
MKSEELMILAKPSGGDDSRPVTEPSRPPTAADGEDYYCEGGMIVFTARYHLRRGYCCQSGCRHCPFGKVPRQQGMQAR